MNKISNIKRTQILNHLVEGSSMRSTARLVGVSMNTVAKILADAGEACIEFHDEYVRGVHPNNVEADEQWAFCYAKDKSINRGQVQNSPDVAGSVWTWTAMDTDTKLIICWLVSPDRSVKYAEEFLTDLASRAHGRFQLNTDGLHSYKNAARKIFESTVDFGQLAKKYELSRYIGSERVTILGKPNKDRINTSYIERHNLTTRMSVRRLSRSTNAFSKRIRYHNYALALYFVWYNFCRVHMTLKQTPAMAAGIADSVHEISWVGELMDAKTPKPAPRGEYKERADTREKTLAFIASRQAELVS